MDAVQAAIDAIDLVNEASALIKRLQEEIKNGNVSEDTLKEVQDVIDRAGALVDKIKENPILKNAVDTIIKNAEEAIKEAAATKALEALKKAIESGDLSKIEEAFEKAQEAIDQLEPYAPDVAKSCATRWRRSRRPMSTACATRWKRRWKTVPIRKSWRS